MEENTFQSLIHINRKKSSSKSEDEDQHIPDNLEKDKCDESFSKKHEDLQELPTPLTCLKDDECSNISQEKDIIEDEIIPTLSLSTALAQHEALLSSEDEQKRDLIRTTSDALQVASSTLLQMKERNNKTKKALLELTSLVEQAQQRWNQRMEEEKILLKHAEEEANSHLSLCSDLSILSEISSEKENFISEQNNNSKDFEIQPP